MLSTPVRIIFLGGTSKTRVSSGQEAEGKWRGGGGGVLHAYRDEDTEGEVSATLNEVKKEGGSGLTGERWNGSVG